MMCRTVPLTPSIAYSHRRPLDPAGAGSTVLAVERERSLHNRSLVARRSGRNMNFVSARTSMSAGPAHRRAIDTEESREMKRVLTDESAGASAEDDVGGDVAVAVSALAKCRENASSGAGEAETLADFSLDGSRYLSRVRSRAQRSAWTPWRSATAWQGRPRR
jgi:hypothetical protein